MFDDHHGELAPLLLDQIAGLDGKITPAGHPDQQGRGHPRRLGHQC